MNESKNIFINSLNRELSKLLEILLENPDSSSKCAIPKIRNMLIMLEEFKYDDSYDNSTFFKNISKQYQSMFVPKMGLSEFNIWDDDFEIRTKKNKEYSNILENINKILNRNELF